MKSAILRHRIDACVAMRCTAQHRGKYRSMWVRRSQHDRYIPSDRTEPSR